MIATILRLFRRFEPITRMVIGSLYMLLNKGNTVYSMLLKASRTASGSAVLRDTEA